MTWRGEGGHVGGHNEVGHGGEGGRWNLQLGGGEGGEVPGERVSGEGRGGGGGGGDSSLFCTSEVCQGQYKIEYVGTVLDCQMDILG